MVSKAKAKANINITICIIIFLLLVSAVLIYLFNKKSTNESFKTGEKDYKTGNKDSDGMDEMYTFQMVPYFEYRIEEENKPSKRWSDMKDIYDELYPSIEKKIFNEYIKTLYTKHIEGKFDIYKFPLLENDVKFIKRKIRNEIRIKIRTAIKLAERYLKNNKIKAYNGRKQKTRLYRNLTKYLKYKLLNDFFDYSKSKSKRIHAYLFGIINDKGILISDYYKNFKNDIDGIMDDDNYVVSDDSPLYPLKQIVSNKTKIENALRYVKIPGGWGGTGIYHKCHVYLERDEKGNPTSYKFTDGYRDAELLAINILDLRQNIRDIFGMPQHKKPNYLIYSDDFVLKYIKNKAIDTGDKGLISLFGGGHFNIHTINKNRIIQKNGVINS